MFVLVTDLSDTESKIRPGISADPQLPPLPCVTGAFLTSVTSAGFCACVGSHGLVVTRADSISKLQSICPKTPERPQLHFLCLQWQRLTPSSFWHLSTVPKYRLSPWRRWWARIRRRGGFPSQTVRRRQRRGNTRILNQHPRWTTSSSTPKWSDFSSWDTLTVTSWGCWRASVMTPRPTTSWRSW